MDKSFIENPVEAYAELKAENERLKAEFRIESLTDKTTEETIYRSNLVNKYKSCLQEIKNILRKFVKKNVDMFKKRDVLIVIVDLGGAILDLITKAEEE